MHNKNKQVAFITKLLHTVEKILQTKTKIMKALVTILFCTVLFSTASANNFDGLKIAPNAKTATIEVRLTSKKVTDAKIVITDEAGKIVSTQTAKLATGDNAIALVDVSKLEEGNYTVTLTAGTDVMTTKFVNWKL